MENVCRTCLRTTNAFTPLFNNACLLKKIETISSLSIVDINGLPRQICEECVKNINSYCNFRNVILNTDLELKQRLAAISNKEKIVNENRVDIKKEIKIEPFDLEIENMKVITVNKSYTILKESAASPKNIANASGYKLFSRNRQFKCKICNYKTASALCMINHKRVHSKSTCNVCTKIVPTNRLKKHVAAHTVTKSVCNICGKSIRSDNLKKHIECHTEAPVTCKECGKTLKHRESLRSHMLSHRFPTFTCEYCGKIYKHRTGYHGHIKKAHTPGIEKANKCPLCEKTFHEKNVLTKHMRSHTGERPYPCEYCKKGFSSTNALKTHIRQHTHEKPYTCNFCPMAFPQKVSLRTHLKSKHPTSEQTGTGSD